jgi:outer membrane autotransporter protein
VAAELDALNPLATGMWADVLDELESLPAGEIRSALDQMGGDLHATAETIELQNAAHVLHLVTDRIAYLQEERGRCRCGCGMPGWRGWMLGYGFDGRIDGDGNAPGVEYALSGTAFGIDRELDDFTDGGLFGAYAPGHASRMADDLEAECYDVGAYVSRDFGSHYVLAIAAYEHSEFDTTRRIRFGNVSETARADYDGDGFASYVECGWWREAGFWTVQPLVGLQYVSFLQQGFTERDAEVINLTAGDRSTDSLRSIVGARLLRPLSGSGNDAATVELSSRWFHECLSDEPRLTAAFAGAGGGTFSVASARAGRDFLLLGAGLNVRISRRADAFVGYNGEVGDNLSGHGANGGLQLVW